MSILWTLGHHLVGCYASAPCFKTDVKHLYVYSWHWCGKQGRKWRTDHALPSLSMLRWSIHYTSSGTQTLPTFLNRSTLPCSIRRVIQRHCYKNYNVKFTSVTSTLHLSGWWHHPSLTIIIKWNETAPVHPESATLRSRCADTTN